MMSWGEQNTGLKIWNKYVSSVFTLSSGEIITFIYRTWAVCEVKQKQISQFKPMASVTQT